MDLGGATWSEQKVKLVSNFVVDNESHIVFDA